MPLRGGTAGGDRFATACKQIRRTADRVYGKDSSRAQACKRVADRFETMVTREDHTADYNPYQALADRLKADFPEVWTGDQFNSGQKALKAWQVS